jgi:cytochrome c556
MKSFVLAGLGLAALGGVSLAWAQGDVIAQRRAGMKRSGEVMTQMKAVADAGAEGRQFTGAIDDMIAFYQRVPTLFPAGSGTGDTKALPAIWSENAGFVAANNAAIEKLRALRTASASGDGAAFQGAWRAVGPECGGCHRTYRARDTAR